MNRHRMLAAADHHRAKVAGSLHEEITSLRGKVQQLMDERVRPAMHDTADLASAYSRQARDAVADQTERTSLIVREHPLGAIGVAISVGIAIGFIAAAMVRPAK